MATSKYQSTHFSIYRFNIIPLDPNSFQADLFEFRSLEELLDKKNDIFSTIVEHLSETTKGYKISVIQMKKVDEYQYIFLLEAKRSKIVEWRQKNKIIPHFPTIWVAIDISPSVQVIAIQKRSGFCQNDDTPINTIKKSISKPLKEKYLKINIYPVQTPDSFWDYVASHGDVISSVEFEISAPNLPYFSSTIGEELKELGKSSNSGTTKLSMKSPKGEVLKLDPKNKSLAGLVDVVEKGGGKSSFTHKGSHKKLYPNNKQIIIDAPPFDNKLNKLEKKESILTKIRECFKIGL